MFDRQQTMKNAVLTVVQVAVSATFLFAVYKYLLSVLGAPRLGVWSIVMALSTVTRISDLGFAGGMTRFVAKYRALEDGAAIIECVETAAVSLVALSGAIVLVAYPVLLWSLPLVFDPQALQDALALLPFSLLSFGLLAVSGVFLSTLDGLQRADLRNLILISGTLVYGGLIPLLVWRIGFVGLGWAQLTQSSLILAASWFTARRHIGLRRLVPLRWQRHRFKQMLAYNLHLQFSTLAAFLADPLTKLLLGHFGSLSMVGYYEMASKMVSQFRAIVVNVNQVFVPIIAHAHETARDQVKTTFEQSYSALLLISVTFYSGVAIGIPLASALWIGRYDEFFVAAAYMLLLAMQLNTLIGPAYFSNLGTGNVAVNSRSQLIIGGANLTLTPLLGAAIGGPGVVAGYAGAIVAGSAYLMLRFLQAEGMSAASLLPRGLLGRLCATAGLVLAAGVAGQFLRHASALILLGVAALGWALLLGLMGSPLAGHPVIRSALQRRRHHA